MAEKNDEVKSYGEKPLDTYGEFDLPGKSVLYDAVIITIIFYMRAQATPIHAISL